MDQQIDFCCDDCLNIRSVTWAQADARRRWNSNGGEAPAVQPAAAIEPFRPFTDSVSAVQPFLEFEGRGEKASK